MAGKKGMTRERLTCVNDIVRKHVREDYATLREDIRAAGTEVLAISKQADKDSADFREMLKFLEENGKGAMPGANKLRAQIGMIGDTVEAAMVKERNLKAKLSKAAFFAMTDNMTADDLWAIVERDVLPKMETAAQRKARLK